MPQGGVTLHASAVNAAYRRGATQTHMTNHISKPVGVVFLFHGRLRPAVTRFRMVLRSSIQHFGLARQRLRRASQASAFRQTVVRCTENGGPKTGVRVQWHFLSAVILAKAGSQRLSLCSEP